MTEREKIVIDGHTLEQALKLRNAIYAAVEQANHDIADRIFAELWPKLAELLGKR